MAVARPMAAPPLATDSAAPPTDPIMLVTDEMAFVCVSVTYVSFMSVTSQSRSVLILLFAVAVSASRRFVAASSMSLRVSTVSSDIF